MSVKSNHLLGGACIVIGIVIVVVALGDLLLRVGVTLAALTLVNYGLRLRGLPPLQLLLPLIASRKRWF